MIGIHYNGPRPEPHCLNWIRSVYPNYVDKIHPKHQWHLVGTPPPRMETSWLTEHVDYGGWRTRTPCVRPSLSAEPWWCAEVTAASEDEANAMCFRAYPNLTRRPDVRVKGRVEFVDWDEGVGATYYVGPLGRCRVVAQGWRRNGAMRLVERMLGLPQIRRASVGKE
jgi:hypothetical protein